MVTILCISAFSDGNFDEISGNYDISLITSFFCFDKISFSQNWFACIGFRIMLSVGDFADLQYLLLVI
jgi:hypothetical protein